MAAPGNKTDIQAALGRLIVRFNETVSKEYAAKAEKIAQENRPWTDRTSDARKLIKGVPYCDEEITVDTYTHDSKGNKVKAGTVTIDRKGSVGFMVLHRAEYGKHLETANDGKYAILKPTIQGIKPAFDAAVRAFFGGKR